MAAPGLVQSIGLQQSPNNQAITILFPADGMRASCFTTHSPSTVPLATSRKPDALHKKWLFPNPAQSLPAHAPSPIGTTKPSSKPPSPCP